jgi:hypothetical protein
MRLGSTLSVLDFADIGSALSLRAFSRLGSSVSLMGINRCGSSLSVFDFFHLGSQLSLRSYARLGSSLSVFGNANVGGRFSVLDFVHLGSTLSVGNLRVQTAGLLHDGGATAPTATYTKYSETDIKFYAQAQLAMTATVDGGMLHGAWSAEATVTTSDRRLKTSIEPLYRTIAARANSVGTQATQDKPGESSSEASDKGESPPIDWLLRELRPVSFRLKRGPEAKYLKFGFIAQELESVFPNLVRSVGDDDTKAVAIQDLIAVLTLAFQSLQKQYETQQQEMDDQHTRLHRLEQLVQAHQARQKIVQV